MRLPTALTMIRAIALADGKLKGHPDYLTKYEMIAICREWLRRRALKRKAKR